MQVSADAGPQGGVGCGRRGPGRGGGIGDRPGNDAACRSTGRCSGPGLRGEPGVSYLVQAGGERLLFDTGLNLFRRSRSALVDNAEALGVDLAQLPAVVLSHQHEDYVGGVRTERAGSFAFSGDPVEPPGLVAHASVPLTHPIADVRATTRATVLAPGIDVAPAPAGGAVLG